MSKRVILSLLLGLMLATATTISLLATTGYVSVTEDGLSTFESWDDLYSFVREQQLLPGGAEGLWTFSEEAREAGIVASVDFSGTNVQVEGVDEADVVKTDGRYLYVASKGEVDIIKVYPPEELGLISKVTAADLFGQEADRVRLMGLFLTDDRLVVLASTVGYITYLEVEPGFPKEPALEPMEQRTYVSVVDVSNPAQPAVVHRLSVSGDYVASRLLAGHVYLVVQRPILLGDEESRPTICQGDGCEEFSLERVLYDPDTMQPSLLLTITALDVMTGEYDYLSILTGFASTVYMSTNNLYVTVTRWTYSPTFALPAAADSGPNTSIYKIGVEGTRIWSAASAEVPGFLLNQFSMDEEGGYLRVVTVSGWEEPLNNVYVLDDDMDMVGSLEGLAPGEMIYSARFVGDVVYLVTFKRVDPFFVIDLSDPTSPQVLGQVKVPGFSEYLHPLDKSHILGIGKESTEEPDQDFAWFEGLKVSLFDVSTPTEPVELDRYAIGDRGTSSPVLWDHRAFLFIGSRSMAVFPVELARLEIPQSSPWDYGRVVWQGAYVLSVAPGEGISVLGSVSHFELLGHTIYHPIAHAPYAVKRSFYVGDYLYTISDAMVRVDTLEGLVYVGHIIYRAPSTIEDTT